VRGGSDGADANGDDHEDMSANTNLTPHHTETSGESVFFAMAIAFAVVLVAIIVGAFLPVAVGVGLIFGVLAIVLAVVGVFIARVLGEG
jgi:hypothetical protein